MNVSRGVALANMAALTTGMHSGLDGIDVEIRDGENESVLVTIRRRSTRLERSYLAADMDDVSAFGRFIDDMCADLIAAEHSGGRS